jgi:hypothetical protein
MYSQNKGFSCQCTVKIKDSPANVQSKQRILLPMYSQNKGFSCQCTVKTQDANVQSKHRILLPMYSQNKGFSCQCTVKIKDSPANVQSKLRMSVPTYNQNRHVALSILIQNSSYLCSRKPTFTFLLSICNSALHNNNIFRRLNKPKHTRKRKCHGVKKSGLEFSYSLLHLKAMKEILEKYRTQCRSISKLNIHLTKPHKFRKVIISVKTYSEW